MTSRELLATVVVAAPAAAALLVALAPRRAVRAVALACALPAGGLALALAAVALRSPGAPTVRNLIVVDAAGGLLVGVIGLVGLASVLLSPAYLDGVRASLFSEPRRERAYFVVLFLFWAVLLAVPLAGNLGAAWLLVEATTAISALLVGFSGKPRALEAGWKYLVLTSLGLGVALLGIVLLAAGIPGGRLAGLSWHELGGYAAGSDRALVAYLLLLAGLAAKIGWAPVHNWLPDAHSEAPPPVSALLSAALLPAVLLVAWRSEQSLAPVVGASLAGGVLVGFGLLSLAVAVPFLWRSLAWKRLLAYSSLEHMGVLALGIGFATPLALAGVAVHLVGHALAKALGFYAATPLLDHDPRTSRRAASGIARTQPALARDARDLARLAGGAAALAAVCQRGADRRRRLPGRSPLGGRRDRVPARARLPRPGPRAARDDRGRAAPPRRRAVAAARARRPSRSSGRCCSARSRSPRSGCPAASIVAALLRGDLVSGYRERVAEALAGGWRFAGLHATATDVRTLLVGARRGDAAGVDSGRRGAGAVDRRPRAGRRLGRARGARPLRRRLRRARAAAPAASTTTRASTAGPSRCTATTPTRSRSARSTPA